MTEAERALTAHWKDALTAHQCGDVDLVWASMSHPTTVRIYTWVCTNCCAWGKQASAERPVDVSDDLYLELTSFQERVEKYIESLPFESDESGDKIVCVRYPLVRVEGYRDTCEGDVEPICYWYDFLGGKLVFVDTGHDPNGYVDGYINGRRGTPTTQQKMRSKLT